MADKSSKLCKITEADNQSVRTDTQHRKFATCQEQEEPSSASVVPWADLIEEALAEVFTRLPFEDRLRTVALVCKSWRDASYNPACWRYVDMEDWFQKKTEEDYWWEYECEPKVEALVKKVVDRSCGQLKELRTKHCSDAALDYISERCPALTVLSIPNSLFVTDMSMTNLALNCRKLEALDASDCYNISNQALEAVGRYCPSMVWLGRNMLQQSHFIGDDNVYPGDNIPGGDEEAIVVSKHMVNLRHLEMKKTSLSNKGLAHLARGCVQLSSLNLACCTSLSTSALDRVSEKCPNIVDFTKPITPRMYVSSNRLRVLFG